MWRFANFRCYHVGVHLAPGLPHGRLWVAEQGCSCDSCAARLRERSFAVDAAARVEESDEVRRQRVADGYRPRPRLASTTLTWRKVANRWVVCGPVEKMRLGTVHVRNMTTNKVSEVYVHRLGKPFTGSDGVTLRYGYIRR